MADDIATQVRRLTDLEEIRSRKALYGKLVDGWLSSRDEALLDGVCDLFTPDGVADFGDLLGVHEGRVGIRRLFGELVPQGAAWTWHSFHSPLIEIDGDRAHAEWTIYALAATDGPARAVYGRYIDDYVRTDDGWRQTRLAYRDETRAG